MRGLQRKMRVEGRRRGEGLGEGGWRLLKKIPEKRDWRSISIHIIRSK